MAPVTLFAIYGLILNNKSFMDTLGCKVNLWAETKK